MSEENLKPDGEHAERPFQFSRNLPKTSYTYKNGFKSIIYLKKDSNSKQKISDKKS